MGWQPASKGGRTLSTLQLLSLQSTWPYLALQVLTSVMSASCTTCRPAAPCILGLSRGPALGQVLVQAADAKLSVGFDVPSALLASGSSK
jgi:hypothetical protein